MQKDSSGKALLLGFASLMCSSQIMDSSLIARCSEIIVVSWGLLTGILLRLTLKGNGQAEAVNKVILSGLKKRLDDAKGK